MECKNCGHIVEGKYCIDCGQKSNIERITLSSLLKELSESIFQIDSGFFFTLMQLFRRPGNSIREYLDGKRRRHFKPIAYLLTFSTIYFIISKMIGQHTWMHDLITGFAQGGSHKKEIPAILTWFAKNYAYTTLLLIPVFSFASFLCFWGKEKNYIEHLVVNSYVTGQQAIIYSLFSILKKFIAGGLLELLPTIIAICYALVAYWQFFNKGNRMNILFRSFFTYILYILMNLCILILIMGIADFIN